MEHGFTWYAASPFANWIPSPIFHALLSLLILCLIAWRINRSLKKAPDPLIPESRLSTRNIFEIVVQAIYAQIRNIIGPDGDKFIPLIGGIFIYIFLCNVIGVLPGFESATSNLWNNFAIALVVFLFYNYAGFKAHGIGYLKQFAGPVLYLAPLMFIIEIISHLFRPLSLSLRLFGNMFGDHMVLSIFSDLTYVVVPVIFLMFGIFVSLVQAFVFAILTTVYIALAVSHDH